MPGVVLLKYKKWYCYLIYALGIYLFLFLSQIYYSTIRIGFSQARYSYTYVVNLPLVLFFFLGLLLGLEYLYKEYLKKGSWKVNYAKLIFFSIPCILLGALNYINIFQFLGFNFLPDIGIFNVQLPFFILGFGVTTSLYKNQD